MSQPTGLPPSMQPNRAQPDGRAVDLRPVRWAWVEAGQGNQLRVHYTITGRRDCNVLGQVHVTETSASVAVTLLIGRLPNANCGGPQPQLAAQFLTVVTLREPLGGRRVEDGAAGPPPAGR